MSNYTVKTAKHATLGANASDTITHDPASAIEVLSRADFDVYFTLGDDPVSVLGDDCYIVPARGNLKVPRSSSKARKVNVISSGACAYSVNAIP